MTVGVAVLGVVAAYGVVNPSWAMAGSLSGSTFEIDGAPAVDPAVTDANLVVDDPGHIDWLNDAGTAMRSGVLVRDDLPTGSTDDSFTQGTNINNPPGASVTLGGIPNNKSDLTHFGIYKEENGSDPFINVFWTRVQAPSGTTTMDFEFNQSPNRSNAWGSKHPPYYPNQVIPVRLPGDILVSYLLGNGGTDPHLTKRIWNGSAWGAETAFSASDGLAAINTSAIAAADSGGLGALDALTFGEASIRLSAFASGEDTCRTFGSVYLRSRSSDTDTDENKDFIAPEPITISNCGSVTIHKTDDNGALQGAEFTLYHNVAPLAAPHGTGDTITTLKCTTDANGDCTIQNVPKGEYLAVETVTPAGHDSAPDQRVTITAGDQVVPLTFNDPIQHGHIIVIKNAVPDDAQDFTFTLDGANGVTLDDDPASATPNQHDYTVVVGEHTLAETNIPSGWVNTGLVCDDNNPTSVSKPTAVVNVSKNETVTCTYTDTFTTLTPTLATQVAVASANTSWNDTATLTGDGVHPVTGTVSFYVCGPTASPASCNSTANKVGSDVAVSGGSATTSAPFVPATAGNYCFRAEFHSTSAFYNDTTHTNATTECFLKRNANLTVSKTATASYGRVYHWTIAKDVNQTHFDIAQGGNAHVTYTVTVGNTHTDSSWTVAGTITVTNPNNTAFTNVDVTDSINNGAGSCVVGGGSNATVPANGTLSLDYTCTYGSAPNPAAGTNTATATWDAAAFFTTAGTASGTANVDFSTVSPTTTDEVVTVTDPMGGGTLGTVNAVLNPTPNPRTFTYSVDKAGVPGTCTTYDNTATFTTNDTQSSDSASQSVVVCVGKDLVVTKSVTATFDRTYNWLIDKAVRGEKVRDVPAGTSPSFTYDVTVSPNGYVDSNFAMSGSIHVVNPNDWEDIVATVTDTSDVGGGVSCAVTNGVSRTVPKGGAIDLAYTCSFTGKPVNGINTATATWSAATAHTPSGTASGHADVAFQVVHETNKTITVTDTKATPTTLGTVSYADAPHTFTYTREVPGTPGTCVDDTNTARIVETGQSASQTVTVCVGLNLTVRKTALATDHRTYLWTITKDVDKTRVEMNDNDTATFHYTVTAHPAGVTRDGWSVTGNVTVTNPNDWEDITVDLSDSLDSGGGADCSFPGGSHVVVPKSSAPSFAYSCSFASQPADGTNTATATWDKAAAATPSGTASGTASVVFVPATETNKTVTVIDDKTDPENPVVLGTATYGDTPTSFEYDVTKEGVAGTCTPYTNTAILVPQSDQLALADQQILDTAQQTVTVCVGQGVTTAMTGTASLDRAYNWLIDKSVDQTRVTLPNGQSATFSYTVTVTPNGIVDSGYTMGGSVTAANPNDWEDIVADVTVVSDVGGGVACSVAGGTGVTIPKSGEVTLPYTCSFTGAPALSGTNTATSTWNADDASTVDTSSSDSVPVEFSINGNTNRTITVTDDKTDPANPVQLGTATYDDGEKAFTYSLTKAGSPGTAAGPVCVDYTNVAAIVETEQSDSQLVTVCHTFTGGGGKPVVNPPSGGGLPFTGDGIGLLAREAMGLILAGLLLLVLNRRKRRTA